ncbi:unnamed protein product [Lymnaea stagnalis]|uniref:Uncharacterized protein n=1 Tax=Lymnaea stagnalis TaxID=6523 RepID=A0AAV2GZ32_LYMST
MKSTLTDHCLLKLESLHKNALQIIESLTKSLTRIQKIDKNINSVLNCQKLLSDKLVKLKTSTKSQLKVMEKDTGYFTGPGIQESSGRPSGPLVVSGDLAVVGAERLPKEEGMREPHLSAGFNDDVKLVSHQSLVLENKLQQLQKMLNENLSIIQSLDDSSLQSRGSMSRNASAIYQPDLDGNT